MTLNRPHLRATIACGLAALATSALLAGAALASPAAASAGRSRAPKAPQRLARRLPHRSADLNRLPKPLQRATGRLTGRSASAADANDSFSTHVTPANTFYLQLDVGGASTSPGAGVIDWWTNGGANQAWTFTRITGNANTFEIINQNSGQCLTTDGVAGDQVYQEPCDQGTAQEWITGLRPATFSSAYAIESAYSGLYLDVNGDSPWPDTSIDTWYWNGGYNQYFAAD
jgi:Ricin-type beta-trefoil lectin domain-like